MNIRYRTLPLERHASRIEISGVYVSNTFLSERRKIDFECLQVFLSMAPSFGIEEPGSSGWRIMFAYMLCLLRPMVQKVLSSRQDGGPYCGIKGSDLVTSM